MSSTLLLRNYSVHVPSFARARLLPTFFLRRPLIYLEGHHGFSVEVVYPLGSWEVAKKDYFKLLRAMNECNRALDSVQDPLNESERKLQ